MDRCRLAHGPQLRVGKQLSLVQLGMGRRCPRLTMISIRACLGTLMFIIYVAEVANRYALPLLVSRSILPGRAGQLGLLPEGR